MTHYDLDKAEFQARYQKGYPHSFKPDECVKIDWGLFQRAVTKTSTPPS